MHLGDYLAAKQHFHPREVFLHLISKAQREKLNEHRVVVEGEGENEVVQYHFPGHVDPATISVCVIERWESLGEEHFAVIILRFPLGGTMEVERSTRCVI